MSVHKVAILGASRGLGARLARCLAHGSDLLLVARKQPLLEKLSATLSTPERAVEIFGGDFSRPENFGALNLALQKFAPTHVVYTAGGGPYGRYGEKKWSDHAWALNVNLIFPARVVHSALSEEMGASVKQVIIVGSAIAENGPETKGASYGAAKCGLRGLVTAIQSEGTGSLDLRLYSPGYIDTELLPPYAWPRQIPGQVLSVDEVVADLKPWMFDMSQMNKNRSFAR